MKYSILLFDADNTVLDFDKSEEQALKIAFGVNGLTFDSHVLSVYRKNNIAQWQRLERGEIKVEEVLVKRFAETFRELNFQADISAVSTIYEEKLHLGFFTMPFAEEVLAHLQSLCRLYIVSNGVLSIQNSRMRGSGLDKYFLKRFISEEIGFPKPDIRFFESSFSQIENFDKSSTLIIGDSLTSDIQGGINCKIDTCWYNPNGICNTTQFTPTYEIADLRQLLKIVL